MSEKRQRARGDVIDEAVEPDAVHLHRVLALGRPSGQAALGGAEAASANEHRVVVEVERLARRVEVGARVERDVHVHAARGGARVREAAHLHVGHELGHSRCGGGGGAPPASHLMTVAIKAEEAVARNGHHHRNADGPAARVDGGHRQREQRRLSGDGLAHGRVVLVQLESGRGEVEEARSGREEGAQGAIAERAAPREQYGHKAARVRRPGERLVIPVVWPLGEGGAVGLGERVRTEGLRDAHAALEGARHVPGARRAVSELAEPYRAEACAGEGHEGTSQGRPASRPIGDAHIGDELRKVGEGLPGRGEVDSIERHVECDRRACRGGPQRGLKVVAARREAHELLVGQADRDCSVRAAAPTAARRAPKPREARKPAPLHGHTHAPIGRSERRPDRREARRRVVRVREPQLRKVDLVERDGDAHLTSGLRRGPADERGRPEGHGRCVALVAPAADGVVEPREEGIEAAPTKGDGRAAVPIARQTTRWLHGHLFELLIVLVVQRRRAKVDRVERQIELTRARVRLRVGGAHDAAVAQLGGDRHVLGAREDARVEAAVGEVDAERARDGVVGAQRVGESEVGVGAPSAAEPRRAIREGEEALS